MPLGQESLELPQDYGHSLVKTEQSIKKELVSGQEKETNQT